MDSHSRLVGWLKVALPLAALALLSTLFLIARRIDPEAALPYAEVDVADRLREPRMTAPAYAGVTADGAAITVTAAEARPGEGSATAASVAAQLVTADGARTALSAGMVTLDETAGNLRLAGGVQIATPQGYELRTESVSMTLDRTAAESGGMVEGFGPAGRITAGGMEFRTDAAAPGSYVLVFNRGVSLIYQPADLP